MGERSSSYPSMETDSAQDWTDEFFRIWGPSLPDELDEDVMRGWFANAIETGRAFAESKHRQAESRERELVAALGITAKRLHDESADGTHRGTFSECAAHRCVMNRALLNQDRSDTKQVSKDHSDGR